MVNINMPRLKQVTPSASNDQHGMSCEIMNHSWTKEGTLKLKVRLDSGTEYSVTGEEAKVDFPEVLAAYIKPKGTKGKLKAWSEWAEKIDTSRVDNTPAIVAAGRHDRKSAQIPARKSNFGSTKEVEIAKSPVGIVNADESGSIVDLSDERELSNNRSQNGNAEDITTLTDQDIVFFWNDDGDLCQLEKQVGNIAFRKLVGKVKTSMPLPKKAHYAKGMVQSLYDHGGRFLEKIETAAGERFRDFGRKKATELTLNILNGVQLTSSILTKSPKTPSMPDQEGKGSEGRTSSTSYNKRPREDDKQQPGLARMKISKTSPSTKFSNDPVAARALAALTQEDSGESSSESDSNDNISYGNKNSSSPKPDTKLAAHKMTIATNLPNDNNKSSSLIPDSISPRTSVCRNNLSSSSTHAINETKPPNLTPPNVVVPHINATEVDNSAIVTDEKNRPASPSTQGIQTTNQSTQHESNQPPKKVKMTIPQNERKIKLTLSQSLSASKFPVGCPVGFNFRAAPTHLSLFTSLGSTSLGVVDSVEMTISTQQRIYHVKKRMTAETEIFCEDDLAFATNCPVYIEAEKEQKVRGEVLVCKWGDCCGGEGGNKSYTVAVHGNGDECHILDKVEEQHLKFRNELTQIDDITNDDERPSKNYLHNPTGLPSNESNHQTSMHFLSQQGSQHTRTDVDCDKRTLTFETQHSNPSLLHNTWGHETALSSGGSRNDTSSRSVAKDHMQKEEISKGDDQFTQNVRRPNNQIGDEPDVNNVEPQSMIAANHMHVAPNDQCRRLPYKNIHSSVGNSAHKGSFASPTFETRVEQDVDSSSSLSYDDINGEHQKSNRAKDDASRSVILEMARNESASNDSRRDSNTLTSSMTVRGDNGMTMLRIDIPLWLQQDPELRVRLYSKFNLLR